VLAPAPLPLLATDLVDRWRDVGPVLWVIAAATAGLWVAMVVAFVVASEPRRVAGTPAALEPGGPEPPAVVNLLTKDWELGHESVPATLLDLAARRHLSIDWIGERTLVRVQTATRARPDPLTDYEQMVLAHVRALATQTADGFVPADALTTGPDAVATSWWRRFEKSVSRDARDRGLSRPRFGARVRTALVVGAIVVGVAVFAAATTLPRTDDDNPIGAAAGFGVIAVALLVTISTRLRGERDTDAGRLAAARWLGLRTMLADDPTFATQPPAAVAIWDRIIGYGAALGVARGAVAALPLGAESEREAWSAVGGRWRVVRVRYPRRLPPGYGRHPALVAFVGLIFTALGIVVAPATISLSESLLDSLDDLAADGSVPLAVRTTVGVAVAVIIAIGATIGIVGAAMLLGGGTDLARPRRTIEGRVLRLRVRGDEQHRFWHVAVDDGSTDRVRAWRVATSPPVSQGGLARARVSPWLHHVTDLQSTGDTQAAAAPTMTVVPSAAPAVTAPPPPLPDDAAVAAAVGRPMALTAGATVHPLAVDGASATYAGPDGSRLVVAWVRPDLIDGFRHLPRPLSTAIDGIGDEAYRAPMGGGIVARCNGHVLLVTPSLPGLDDADRDRAVEAVARTACSPFPF
jgi:hypothetical protein